MSTAHPCNPLDSWYSTVLYADRRKEPRWCLGGDQRQPGWLQQRREDAPDSVITDKEARYLHLKAFRCNPFGFFLLCLCVSRSALCSCGEMPPSENNSWIRGRSAWWLASWQPDEPKLGFSVCVCNDISLITLFSPSIISSVHQSVQRQCCYYHFLVSVFIFIWAFNTTPFLRRVVSSLYFFLWISENLLAMHF